MKIIIIYIYYYLTLAILNTYSKITIISIFEGKKIRLKKFYKFADFICLNNLFFNDVTNIFNAIYIYITFNNKVLIVKAWNII